MLPLNQTLLIIAKLPFTNDFRIDNKPTKPTLFQSGRIHNIFNDSKLKYLFNGSISLFFDNHL